MYCRQIQQGKDKGKGKGKERIQDFAAWSKG